MRSHLRSLLMITLAIMLSITSEAISAAPMFDEKAIYIDFSGGAGLAGGLTFNRLVDETYRMHDYMVLMQSDNTLKHLAALNHLNETGSKMKGDFVHARGSVEVSFTDWFGVRGVIDTTRITARNVNAADGFISSSGFLFYYTGYFKNINNFTIYDLLKFKNYDKSLSSASTIGPSVVFHIPTNNRFDPYFALDFGFGNYRGRTIFRGGASLGLRIFLSDKIYIFAEGFGASYTGTASSSTYTDDSGDSTTTYSYTGFSVGGGRGGIGLKLFWRE